MLLNHELRDIEVVRAFESIPPVAGSPGELNQVWTNLLSNAIQAMDGAGRLVVETELLAGPRVKVAITDSGPGIADADLTRIFDLHFTTKGGRVEFGLGLGLTISRDIIERHQGTIEVESRPGVTSFRVVLPAAAAGEDQT